MIIKMVLWSTLCWRVSSGQYACESGIFCHGPILDTVQRAQLFLDPKRFVDMPTKFPKDQVR